MTTGGASFSMLTSRNRSFDRIEIIRGDGEPPSPLLSKMKWGFTYG